QLCSDRDDHSDLSADLLRYAAGGRAVRRPPAATLLARCRHGRHLRRPVAAGDRRQLPDAGFRRRTGGGRLRGLPPGGLRVARMASGGRHGLAQSLFQVGGNVGSSLGPVLAAFIVIPRGQSSIAWFSAAALLAITVLLVVGNWYRRERAAPPRGTAR